MSLNITKRHTRASNATRHPGAIILEAQVKRRTKAEIAADDEAQHQAQAMSDSVSKAVLAQIATLEAEMEAKQTQVLSSKPSATRPKPKARIRTKSQAGKTIPEAVEGDAKGVECSVPEDTMAGADVEAFGEDASEDGEANDGKKRRVSRRPGKSSFREKVKEAHRILDQPLNNGHEDKKTTHAVHNQISVLTESTLYFLNITSNHSTTKASLTGLVRNWASAVVPSNISKGTPSCTARDTAPTKSKALSTTTHSSNALAPLTPVNSVADASSLCIAGLEEGEDDIYEHSISIKGNVNSKGDDTRKSLLLSIANEDDNFTSKQSQHSTSTRLKRKVSNTISLSSREEFELDRTGMDDSTMGIDSDIEITGIVKLSESEVKAPLVKKVKTDVKIKTEPVESTTVPSGSGHPLKAEGVVKPCSAYCKEDLLGFILSDPQGHWHKKFLPTLILLLGSISNPFDLPETSLLQFAQSTFHIIYPEVHDFVITFTGPVIAKILQRFCKWWSNFSSTTIALILDFMAHDKTRDAVEKHEIYRSTFIITLLGSVHLTAIQGHATVPTLKTEELAYPGMQGAVRMCSAAVERALTLIQKGHINVDNSLRSIKGGKLSVTLPKSLNKYTGKQTSAPYLFSDQLWGHAVRSYAHSISTRGDDYIHDIVQLARETMQGTGVLPHSTDTGSDEPEELDEHAYLSYDSSY
ncbi:hypothetical protein PAXRUDRAFT_16112 [Paxillus rubicundulus Ve08.2h10]|uniref:Uncharacterized protein n=1 Tax=Paxillus rubicundulus Ve08.2h10 TaxID=930991 RepID=A0A0D0DFH1_9AGAM|nr:hypothetical protein PAXRUDRAFT_16112 [Paxillus rubicundulus Ve08.2h10]